MSFRKNIILILIVFIIGIFLGSAYKENKINKEIAKEILKDEEVKNLKKNIEAKEMMIDILYKDINEYIEKEVRRDSLLGTKALDLIKNWDSYTTREIKEEIAKMVLIPKEKF